MQPVDLNKVRTVEVETRANKVSLERFARPPEPGRSFAEFINSLPRILVGKDFREIVNAIVTARRNGRPVIAGLGGHVVKCGTAPVIIDLMRRGVLTALALNGAAAIHDFEIAFMGETSEDVAAGLQQGTFGMARQTGELMNEAIARALVNPGMGMGTLLAEQLIQIGAPNLDYSVLVAGRRQNIPVTVHVAIGADIIHMHPTANGQAIGESSFTDFRTLVAAIADLSGGVYLNIGSAVLLPEVFLKAFNIAQNLGMCLRDFVTVNMDMVAHYRPCENVVRRPAAVGGRGYILLGRHEIMIPLLAQAVVEGMAA